MKKILAILFFVSVLCPLSAQIAVDKETVKQFGTTVEQAVEEEQLKKEGIIIRGPETVKVNEDKYVTEEKGYFNGVDYEEGVKKETDEYNVITIKMYANPSVMKQIIIDQFSDTPAIYFNDEHNVIIVKNSDDYRDKTFVKLDYKFSFNDKDEDQVWRDSDADTRTVKGKILQLKIKYAPKYFTFTKKESKNTDSTYPILTFTKETKLYLVPTEEFKKDFVGN